ncbi:hypothetical protein CPB85DRAFT_1429102 [Mucidula mucida]|nr:hypothetical protein CPB85DRAFT_1429102 [Mucidula mucida]
MSTATRDAIKSDTTSEVTRDLKDKLVIQDDALSVLGDDASRDTDAGEAEPSLTSKMLANPDLDEDDDDDDDEYVFEEQDSCATDATDEEDEDVEASTAAVLSELAELRQEKQEYDSDPTKRRPSQSARSEVLPESEDEAVETDGEIATSDSDDEELEGLEAVSTTGPNPLLLKLLQQTDLSDDDSEDEYVPSS